MFLISGIIRIIYDVKDVLEDARRFPKSQRKLRISIILKISRTSGKSRQSRGTGQTYQGYWEYQTSRTPFSVDLKINENKLSIYVLDSSYVPLILNVFIL